MIGIILLIAIVKFILSLYVSSFYPKFNENMKDPLYVTTIILNFVGGFAIFMASFYGSNIYTKIGFPSLTNIILSLVLYDAIYYLTHYMAHYIPTLYEATHVVHHANITELIPIDAFHNDVFENIMYSALLCSFSLLIVENAVEYLIFIFILYSHSLYLHSDVKDKFIIPYFNTSEYHNLHHKIGKGNFGLFFTTWDDFLGTRLSKEYAKNTDLATLPVMTMEEFEGECKKGRKLTIINGYVVDCEKWVNDHPGGKAVIEALVGKDSTESFTQIHSKSIYANEMIKTLTIATLRK